MSEKHKAIAIPVSFIGTTPYLLIVRDRRYKEWTFVTGGCNRREVDTPLKCALRELEEETRGTIVIRSGRYSYFMFEVPQVNRDEEFTAVYHVYILDYSITRETQDELVIEFDVEKQKMDANLRAFRRQYDENDSMEFDTIEGIKKRGNVWPMIRTNILENPEFYKQLAGERTYFSFRT